MERQRREKQITKEQTSEEDETRKATKTRKEPEIKSRARRWLTKSYPGGGLRECIGKGDRLDQGDCRPGGWVDHRSNYGFADIV